MVDSSLILLFIAGTFILILFTFLLVFFVVYYRRKLNQHQLERERLLSDKLEEGERMMNQIAKEVHDNIGQLANFLKMTLRQLEKNSSAEDNERYFSDVKYLTDQIILHSNNISHSLNSDFIKSRGFANVLQDDIEHLRNSAKLNCSLQIEGEINNIHPEKDLVIYRIAQEVFHNITKHAKARNVRILISYMNAGFIMEIKDDGLGFDPLATNGRGIGLVNMRERSRLLNGELQIMSQLGAGCTITLSIPDF